MTKVFCFFLREMWWNLNFSPIPQLLLQSLHGPQADTLQFRGSVEIIFLKNKSTIFSFLASYLIKPLCLLAWVWGDTAWHFSSIFAAAAKYSLPISCSSISFRQCTYCKRQALLILAFKKRLLCNRYEACFHFMTHSILIIIAVGFDV